MLPVWPFDIELRQSTNGAATNGEVLALYPKILAHSNSRSVPSHLLRCRTSFRFHGWLGHVYSAWLGAASGLEDNSDHFSVFIR